MRQFNKEIENSVQLVAYCKMLIYIENAWTCSNSISTTLKEGFKQALLFICERQTKSTHSGDIFIPF